jgi:NADH dehydrogenase
MGNQTPDQLHRVVIVGGGFGGLYAAQELGEAPLQVTLLDKRNYHLFQPLLYQVATGELSPGDISSPLRAILNRQKNTTVLKGEVIDFDPEEGQVILRYGCLHYDSLIVAAGSQVHHFGNSEWGQVAPGLKSVENALEMRRMILSAFEAAEREPDPEARQAWLNFVIVGGGTTGVELAGAIAEMSHGTLKDDFRLIDPSQARIILLEAKDHILPTYPNSLSRRAERALTRLGVEIHTGFMVTGMDEHQVQVESREEKRIFRTRTALWAAGMKASPLGRMLADRTGAQTDKSGRLIVEPDLSLPGYENIFVIGDMARYDYQGESPLPGIAPVAMQQGRYVAGLIRSRLNGENWQPFHYRDKGMLAVIGRNAAVADFGTLKLSGFVAWLVWVFVHILNLIEYDKKTLILMRWAWDYFTRKRGARLIINDEPPRAPADLERKLGKQFQRQAREIEVGD